jgi:DNA (cytosine-5)-methyltransferase 1
MDAFYNDTRQERKNELALFAGAGGGILGGKLLGWRTVCAVELDAYAASVLAQRQNDGILDPFPIWSDIRTFNGYPWQGLVDVVSGGFPCQDISAAGRGAGIFGKRSGLWSEMARVVYEVRPRCVLVENSPMLTSRGLGVVLGDLAEMGFDAEWGVLGADDAGANHRRKRIWILAYAKSIGSIEKTERQEQGFAVFKLCREASALMAHSQCSERRSPGSKKRGDKRRDDTDGLCGREEVPGGAGTGGEVVADASRLQPGRQKQWTERKRAGAGGQSIDVSDGNQAGLQGWCGLEQKNQERPAAEGMRQDLGGRNRSEWWQSEPELGRVAHGVAHRVDRLKAIGNGQVPAVVRLAFKTLNYDFE